MLTRSILVSNQPAAKLVLTLVLFALCPTMASAAEYSWSDGFTLPGPNFRIDSAVVVESDLYVLGQFTHIGNVQVSQLARWDGAAWSSLDWDPSVELRAIAAWNGKLVVAGGRNGEVWIRDGDSWRDLGHEGADPITSMGVYRGDLIVGFGARYNPSTVVIDRFDGAEWTPMPFRVGYREGPVAFTVWGDRLVAAVPFASGAGFRQVRICVWDGTRWDETLEPIGGGSDADVHSLLPVGNDLYVGGVFANIGTLSVPHLARWNGSTWTVIPVDSRGVVALAMFEGKAHVLLEKQGRLALQRIEETGNGITLIEVVSREQGPVPLEIDSFDLLVYENRLVMAGGFEAGPGLPANHIAVLDGRRFRAFGAAGGAGVFGPVHDAVSSIHGVFIGGEFEAAGDASSSNVALWNGASWIAFGDGVPAPVRFVQAIDETPVVVSDEDVVYRWTGRTWEALSANLGASYFGACEVFDGRLVLSGQIRLTDTSSRYSVVWFVDGRYEPLGLGTEVNAIFVIENSLFGFSSAISDDRRLLLHWTGSEWAPVAESIPRGSTDLVRWNDEWVISWTETVGPPNYEEAGVVQSEGSDWVDVVPRQPGIIANIEYIDGELVDVSQPRVWVQGHWEPWRGGVRARPDDRTPQLTKVAATVEWNGSRFIAGTFGAIGELPSSNFGEWRQDPGPVLSPLPGISLRVSAQPNPFHFRAGVIVTSEDAVDAEVDIVDSAGRRVRHFAGPLVDGELRFDWDGRDDRARYVPSGAYWIRARTRDAEHSERVVMVR